MKNRNGQSLIRSASAPETIEAVVAQNISWKKKSDPVDAYEMSSAASAVTPTASRTATPMAPM